MRQKSRNPNHLKARVDGREGGGRERARGGAKGWQESVGKSALREGRAMTGSEEITPGTAKMRGRQPNRNRREEWDTRSGKVSAKLCRTLRCKRAANSTGPEEGRRGKRMHGQNEGRVQ